MSSPVWSLAAAYEYDRRPAGTCVVLPAAEESPEPSQLRDGWDCAEGGDTRVSRARCCGSGRGVGRGRRASRNSRPAVAARFGWLLGLGEGDAGVGEDAQVEGPGAAGSGGPEFAGGVDVAVRFDGGRAGDGA